MGIILELKQVSPYLLEKLKEYPDFVELFLDAKYLPDSPFWHEFTINPDDSDDVEWFNEFTNLAAETLERLIKEKPDEFEKLKEDIPLIIAEGKAKYLDIDKTWRPMIFLLTGYDFYDEYVHQMGLIVSKNQQDNLPLINAVFGGKGIEYYAGDMPLLYLTADEVKKIAEALSKFTQSMIRERLKFKGLKEDSYDHLLDYTYNSLVRYYQDAAEKGNAMFLDFG
ncbi:hypothetical protein NIES4075_27300 [Tolypothrix sp. NIES-4075]|uniref:DUF1877 family protein n=1 Tax=Tolypothrix sp. NIES-4075 TaxID=2005459 RepID=UPI000B5CC2A7|nr:DUF1877 family protein [Tolypothrix sp. NIES-4075]GAX41733.1 hypothetical protein NIES4075_27300 [Tolypothrix sp. NIES-4075]